MIVEALKQSFMDCQLSCTSTIPQIWVIETLARSNQVDTSLLLDLLEKTPEVSDDLGKNAREIVSLRILESFFFQGACGDSVPSSRQKVTLDPSESCEDVLRRILAKTSPSHRKPAGPEMWKWDLKPFIEHKRSSLGKYALQQLKDAVLSGSHPFLSSLKKQSGLPAGNQAEHAALVDDVNCNGIRSRLEGGDKSSSYLLDRDLPNENSVPVTRKRRAASEDAGGNSCENQTLSKNDCETHIKYVKKYKQDTLGSKENVGGKLVSSDIDTQLASTSKASAQHSEGESLSLRRKTHVVMGLNGPLGDDNSKRTSSKLLVAPNEILPCEKQVPPCDIVLNNASEEEQGQDPAIEGVDKFEQNIQRNAPNAGEVEEGDNICGDCDGNSDDGIDIARNNNASFGHQCTHSQDFLAPVNRRDQILLADISEKIVRYTEENGSRFGRKTHVGGMGQNGPCGDGSKECNVKGILNPDEFVPHEKQAPHHGTELPNENFDEEQEQDHDDKNTEGYKKGLHGMVTADDDMDISEKSIPKDVPNVSEAEKVGDISSDSDGYRDERTSIDTKKKTFLSSQCTYSQDSLATTEWRELNLCVKCNKGGKLLVCSSDSCPLVIHESCLGSDASFDTRGKFYCPFCSYSREISNYMKIKRKASLARKDLTTFIFLGTQKESKKQCQVSCKIQQHHLEQDDRLHKSNELKAGPSELSSGYSPPLGGKALDTADTVPHTLDNTQQEREKTRQLSQSPRVHGQRQMAALAIHKSQGENYIKPKKAVICPPETGVTRDQSADAEEISEEENDNSGASKCFITGQKLERKYSYPAIPQLRRKRIPWTSAEEETLREGMRLFCSPHDKIIPWKKILEFGDGIFQQCRTTMDLKDKWRNMSKATPKS